MTHKVVRYLNNANTWNAPLAPITEFDTSTNCIS